MAAPGQAAGALFTVNERTVRGLALAAAAAGVCPLRVESNLSVGGDATSSHSPRRLPLCACLAATSPVYSLGVRQGFRGVYNYKDKYKALLRYKAEAYYCGYHDTAEAAARAFDAQARALGVAEQELNFPGEGVAAQQPPAPPAAPASAALPAREPGTLFAVNAGTGFRGVYGCGKERFQAQFQYKGQSYNCGRHESAERAARAFDAQARALGVPEEELNFPDDPTPAPLTVLPPPPPGTLFSVNAQTGYRGVYNSDRGDKFIALIRYEGAKYNCGRYKTAEAAARAFDAQARSLGVAEEQLNFPGDLTPPETAPPKPVGSLFSVNTSTGYRGVSSSDGDKFKARVCYKGEAYNCGTHKSAIMAARAFDMKARELGIEEVELNFPNDLTPPEMPAPKPPGSLFEVNAAAGYRGVYNYKVKFQARVCYSGIKYSCGTHETAEAAARAFDMKARELGVAEEELNFPHDHRPPQPPAPKPSGTLFSINAETGFRGVYHHKEKYQSRVCYEGAAYNCGTHLSVDAAAKAFDKQARELGVPEEELNFPFGKPRADAAGHARPGAAGALLALATALRGGVADPAAAGGGKPGPKPRASGARKKVERPRGDKSGHPQAAPPMVAGGGGMLPPGMMPGYPMPAGYGPTAYGFWKGVAAPPFWPGLAQPYGMPAAAAAASGAAYWAAQGQQQAAHAAAAQAAAAAGGMFVPSSQFAGHMPPPWAAQYPGGVLSAFGSVGGAAESAGGESRNGPPPIPVFGAPPAAAAMVPPSAFGDLLLSKKRKEMATPEGSGAPPPSG